MGASYEYKKHDFDSEFTKKTDWDDIGDDIFEKHEYEAQNENGETEKQFGFAEKDKSELDEKLKEYRSSEKAKSLNESRQKLEEIYNDKNKLIDDYYSYADKGMGEIVIERDERKTLPMVNYANGTKREAKWANKYQHRDKKPFFMRKSKWNKIQAAKSKIFFEVPNPKYGEITGKKYVSKYTPVIRDENGEYYSGRVVVDLLEMEKAAKNTRAEAKVYEDQYIFGENEAVMDVFDKKIREKQARDHRRENK